MTYTEIVLAIGWFLAGIGWTMWFGERRTRIFVENYKAFGTTNPLQKAAIWEDEGPEERIEEAIDHLTNGKKRQRQPESEKMEFDPETIKNGVKWLQDEAKARGETLSKKDAEDEARRMLMAEGPEMS